jgi:hypothetical protein
MKHLAIALVVALAAPACARTTKPLTIVDAMSGREITLLPAPFPTRCFSGVYRSPHIGSLTLRQRGTEVRGQYSIPERKPAVLGYVEGRVEGNVATIEWSERDASAPGRLFAAGTGFFFYDLPSGERRVQLLGRRRIITQASARSGPVEITRDELWTAVELTPAGCLP